MRDLTVALKLIADGASFVRGIATSEKAMKGFVTEAEALKRSLGSIYGKIAALGVGFSAVRSGIQSAKMDQSLTQIGLTAGVSRSQVAGLRMELFKMSRETGTNLDDLQTAFNSAVQSGQTWEQSLQTTKATNIASAVTGARSEVLANALTVSSTAYQFDLAKPGMALKILDQMTVAGRQGNAELENLSDIFARVGVNASSAGMSFSKTLAFIETLSLIEKHPERLATLADSTLRLFTNLNYMKNASKATGVRFFDDKGNRRDTVAVLKEMKARYDALKTDAEKSMFIGKAFGQADLDTQKGIKTLLQGDMLNTINKFSTETENAGGILKKDLPTAVDNAVNQVGRLKTVLREAADHFAQPVNKAISHAIKFLLDSKEKGGLGLSGEQILAGGAVGLLGTAALARYGGGYIKGMAGKFLGLGTGIAMGKAVEAAAGVTPVFVTNWPVGMGGLGGSPSPFDSGYDALTNTWKGGKAGLPGAARFAPFAAGLPAVTIASTAMGIFSLFQGFNAGNELEKRFANKGPYTLDQYRKDALQNTININLQVDKDGRVFADTKGNNAQTTINTMKRGSF